MSSHDRMVAEAHLARAEAMAEFVCRGYELLKKGLRAAVLRPYRRLTASLN